MTQCHLRGDALRGEASLLRIPGRSSMSADQLRLSIASRWNRTETYFPDSPERWTLNHQAAYRTQNGHLPGEAPRQGGERNIIPSEPRTVFGVTYWPIDHPHAQAQLRPRPTFDEPGNAELYPGWPTPIPGVNRPFNVWPLPRAPRWDELERDSWGDPTRTRDGAGQAWIPHPEGRYDRAYRYAIHITDKPADFMGRFPHGPRARAGTCQNRLCIGRDGCAYCNEDTFTVCYDGCPEERRYWRPVDSDRCECWRPCPSCQQDQPPGAMWDVGEDSLICGDCREEYYTRCQGCDAWYHNDNGHSCPYRCDCATCNGPDARGGEIRNYYYKPEPEFLGTGPLYLGVEIEVSTRRMSLRREAVAGHIQSALGDRAYLKSDSSVNNGFEIVTHPMSLDYAMAEMPWGLWSELSDMGMSEDDSCGIHVHASRDGFSGATHVYRWMKFIHRNKREVQQFARRDSDQWAPFRPEHRAWAVHLAKAGAQAGSSESAYADPNGCRYDYRTGSITGGDPYWWVKDQKRRDQYGDPCNAANSRYAAINVTNEHTIEVRIFAGSVDADEIRGAIQFVHASIEYARQLTAAQVAKKHGWTWRAFTEWLSTRPEYSILRSEIERLVY